MKKALFLDRDGIVNLDKHYLYKVDDFQFVDGIFQLTQFFTDHNYLIFIVTNQSGIGRGYYNESDFSLLSKWVEEQFSYKNIKISQTSHCPHTPDENCKCRKPNPSMVFELQKKFNLDLKNSFFIGDKESDIETAINAKIDNHILVSNKKNINTKAKYLCNSLLDIMELFLNEEIKL